jgi:hypothetical protein
VDRLQRAITPAVCEHLRVCGYAVVDNVFGDACAAALRDEVVALRHTMHRNATHLVRGGGGGGHRPTLVPKQGIFEAELMSPVTQALAPFCSQLQADATLRVMLSLLAAELRLEAQAIKLQRNAGDGACFPIHTDTDAAVDGRRVTAIWYLNPGWRPEHGGQLRLYPFPAAPLDIDPLNDRLVLFSSRRMLHRVLPAHHERYCFTIWLSEAQQRQGSRDADEAERAALARALASDEELGEFRIFLLCGHLVALPCLCILRLFKLLGGRMGAGPRLCPTSCCGLQATTARGGCCCLTRCGCTRPSGRCGMSGGGLWRRATRRARSATSWWAGSTARWL